MEELALMHIQIDLFGTTKKKKKKKGSDQSPKIHLII